MKETIYLRVSERRVEALTKTPPHLGRGEVMVKIALTVDPGVFRGPTLVQELHVEDWISDLRLPALDLQQSPLTETEAGQVISSRIEDMVKALVNRGYTVFMPPEDEDENETL
jgi:hypothetical protein